MPADIKAPSSPSIDLALAPVALRLRTAREALGLSVADVAVRTRITLRHIEALEKGDYTAMPGRPYAIGFARGYARAVGLDGTAIADAVRSELAGGAARPEPRILNQFEVGDPAKTPSHLVGWLALLLIVGILAMGAVFWRSYYAPAVALPSLADKPEPRQADLARAQNRPSASVTAQGTANGPVIFTALEQGIWVKFYDGQGKQLMQKQLSKGESYTVPADAAAPKLWTGRPDALAITIGGQGLPRLAETEQVMKDVPVDAASLLVRSQSPATSPVAASSMPALPPAANP
ncbi:MAG: helix-turn-helix domain-containing protein [Novosphingobium sp.]